MPDNQIPAAQPDSGSEPAEFNFDNPAANPRIKRRSLKAKPAGLIKPADDVVTAARDLEREAPPRTGEPAPATKQQVTAVAKSVPVVVKASETPTAPPRTTPSPSSSTAATRPVQNTTTTRTTPPSTTSSQTTSPHGTRPATLYYSSAQRKEKEAASPMKTVPPAGTSSQASKPSSPSATTIPASTVRTATAPTRPSSPIDYRANVERQSREQKSVGSILSYVVYGLIAFFLISAGLAGYGADVIFKQLHNQSVTVTDLDQRYSDANKELNVKLTVTQGTLSDAQAQIARQQDVIVKQQEELSRLIATANETANALKSEKQNRSQETSNLRSRVKDLENHQTFSR